jgi:hypothetical protein
LIRAFGSGSRLSVERVCVPLSELQARLVELMEKAAPDPAGRDET